MTISRRKFITRSIALGAATLGTGGILNACGSGIARQNLQYHNPAGQTSDMLEKIHRSILYHASLAPSGHNTQPWILRVVAPDEWIIAADPARRLPAVDPQNREVLLSLGAFTENLVLAAGAFGFGVETDVVADDPFAGDVVRIKLTPQNPQDYPLKRITKRMTVKNGYLDKEINTADIKTLSQHFDGRLFYFPVGSPHADCIREGAIEHFREQTRRENAQAEMVRWLRLSDTDARKHRDGLTVKGMEIQGMKGWYVSHFTEPRDFLKPAFIEQSVDMTARQAHQGGGWLIITSSGNTVADLIDTGRRFERMALDVRERMIAIHPMTQFLEEASGINQISAHHTSQMNPQFILRVGYLKTYPRPVTLRRPVDWFVV